MKQKTDRRFMKHNAKTLFDFRFDIHAPPAHEIARRCFRYHLGNLFFLFLVQETFGMAFGSIVKPRQTFKVIAMNPIAQRLPIHPHRFRCRAAFHPIQNVRDPQ